MRSRSVATVVAVVGLAWPLIACSEASDQPPLTAAAPSTAATAPQTQTLTNTPMATATATSTAAAPAGYSSTCAAGYPWGQPVTGPFVCIESPGSGITLAATQQVSGYAGGSFENNVVVTLYDENNVGLVTEALSYTAPDPGFPGTWQLTLTVPPGQPPNSPGRIVASFGSARDGQVIALDSIEVRFP